MYGKAFEKLIFLAYSPKIKTRENYSSLIMQLTFGISISN